MTAAAALPPRLPDWQQRFADCVAQRMGRPFGWSTQDCVLFAADCVQAVTGRDPLEEHRGVQWPTARAAQRMLARQGGLSAAAAARLGPEVLPALAQAGDVGLCADGRRQALAVCDGSAWLAPSAAGLVRVRPELIRRAWRCHGGEHG